MESFKLFFEANNRGKIPYFVGHARISRKSAQYKAEIIPQDWAGGKIKSGSGGYSSSEYDTQEFKIRIDRYLVEMDPQKAAREAIKQLEKIILPNDKRPIKAVSSMMKRLRWESPEIQKPEPEEEVPEQQPVPEVTPEEFGSEGEPNEGSLILFKFPQLHSNGKKTGRILKKITDNYFLVRIASPTGSNDIEVWRDMFVVPPED